MKGSNIMMSKLAEFINRSMTDRREFYYLLQRIVPGSKARNALFSIEKLFKPKPANTNYTPEVIKHSDKLQTSGITYFENLITPEQVEELSAYVQDKKLHDPIIGKSTQFDLNSVPDNIHVAHLSPHDVINAPHVMDIANNPDVLASVERAMGCRPKIGYIEIWWSFPGLKKAKEAQKFHRDIASLRFYNLFIYLTDVDDEAGPHMYVTHSHNSPYLTKNRRFTDAEVEEYFGKENILTLTGKKGSAFMEYTYGIHKGLKPKTKRRLIFQVVYSASQVPFAPKEPLELVNDKNKDLYDPYVNQHVFKTA